MRKIAITGFKGGIGKTTLCVSLGAALALRGQRVLLIDTDTQANLSICLGVKGYTRSLADVLTRKVSAQDCILPARDNLDLLPASLNLYKAQQRMVLEMAREQIFSELLGGLEGYDYLLVDCAPSVSLLTVNTVAFVDELYIPVSMEALALAGAQSFVQYLRETTRQLGHGAAIRLIVPTFFDPRRRMSDIILQTLIRDYGTRVTHPIRIDTKLSEAPGSGQTIYEYAPEARGAADFKRLADQVQAMGPAGPSSG